MHLVTREEIVRELEVGKAEAPAVEVRAPKASKSSLDVVSQMRANLSQLEDLHGRLSFVMGEIRHVVKRASASRS